ncbi:hypothetical protein P879_02388 [Paragonimus westermani]|uniref:Peptidoglycan-recognition protein n=1 Tax=Paragonimus westermani TaxID=34504 RepID=A0A8T0DS62_9TREM|nr:hypothetical protein P879_02388 [Paragonimus westermani]
MVGRFKTATAVVLLVVHLCVLSTQAVQIVSRSGWGARAPSSKRQYISGPVPYVVIHHTTGPTCTGETCKRMVRGFQNYHMNTREFHLGFAILLLFNLEIKLINVSFLVWFRTLNFERCVSSAEKWSDIGYSFLVGNDGKIYEGRGWGVVGAHAKGVNSRSVGIAFIGDFTKSQPSSAAISSARNLIEEGVKRGKISKNYRIRGHRDVNSTTCPGARLYAIIKQWPKYGR